MKIISLLIVSFLVLATEIASAENMLGAGSSMRNTPQQKYTRNLFLKDPVDSLIYEKHPAVIRRVEAKYPKKALADSLEGNVLLKVWVDSSGRVSKPEIVRTDNVIFNKSAITAARQWRFTPAMLHGNPVGVWVSIPFQFKLKQK